MRENAETLTSIAQRVVDDALLLPPSERGAVIAKLIDSLGPEESLSEAEWAAAWGDEIRRRLAAVDAGQSETIPWEEARKITFRRNHEDESKNTP